VPSTRLRNLPGLSVYFRVTETTLQEPPVSLIRPICIVIGLAAAAPAAGQGFVVDLAQHDPGKTDRLSIGPGTGVVEVINRVPSKSYAVATTIRSVPIPELPKPGGSVGLAAGNVCTDPLASVIAGRIESQTTEKAVGGAVTKLQAEASACTEQRREALLTAIKAKTVQTLHAVTLNAGQELEVVVDDGKQKWTVIFTTGPRGTWRTMYGFMFTPNRDETYFAKAEGDKFRVTKQFVGEREYNFVPSVFWSWMPTAWESWWLTPSLTGGLGFDKSNPAVFLGGSFAYNHNIALVVGYVAQRQKRLNANYDPANLPLVESALTGDQLSRDAYRPNVFFGVSFRFSANPFEAAKEPARKAPEKKDEPPAPEQKKELQ